MRNVRSRVDAVMAGAGTLRAERLSLGLDGELGTIGGSSRPQPVAVILTAGGNVPLQDNLIPHQGQQVLVITTRAKAPALAGNLKDVAEVIGVPEYPEGYPDTAHALKHLRQERGIRSVLAEGGPRLNQALVSRGLVDELFLTLAPKLLGGIAQDARTLIDGNLPASVPLRLLSVYLASDELFLRYSLIGPAS